ncbi:hypothetical protein GYMLUDRAFT_960627 [Collybiopsis luxurians FD-317 M1]|nr:hypothetical protein GYMLUDRAFT_960627 [Collybiopsis luxurians FD-317 M1]
MLWPLGKAGTHQAFAYLWLILGLSCGIRLQRFPNREWQMRKRFHTRRFIVGHVYNSIYQLPLVSVTWKYIYRIVMGAVLAVWNEHRRWYGLTFFYLNLLYPKVRALPGLCLEFG